MPDIDPCALVKQADVQALFSVPLGSTFVTDHTGELHVAPQRSVQGRRPGHRRQRRAGRGSAERRHGTGADVKSIGGIGDHASWGLIAAYFPHLGAVKGNDTCELTIGGGNGQLSVPSTGKGVFAKIDDAALPGFMQHLGALCNEIFAGPGEP